MHSIAIAMALVALVLTSPPRAAAQVQTPGPPPTQITLAEALEQALARNRDLAVSRRDIDVSRGRLRQAQRYPFNPELVVEGEGGRGVGREDDQRRGVGGGKIGLSQVIEIRGQRDLRIRAAASEVSRTEWDRARRSARSSPRRRAPSATSCSPRSASGSRARHRPWPPGSARPPESSSMRATSRRSISSAPRSRSAAA